MKRILIGLAVVLVTICIKVAFNHDAEHWGAVKTYSLYLSVIGLVIVFYPVVDKIDELRETNFFRYPLQWIIRLVSVLLIFAVIFGGIILVEKISDGFDSTFRRFIVSRNPKASEAFVENEITVQYNIKRGRYYQNFYGIYYHTSTGVVQGYLQKTASMKFGVNDSIPILYAKDYPSVFILDK
jgi:hypothetical protein